MDKQTNGAPNARPEGWREHGKRATGNALIDFARGEVQFVARGPLDIADTVVEISLGAVLSIAAHHLNQSAAMLHMASVHAQGQLMTKALE